MRPTSASPGARLRAFATTATSVHSCSDTGSVLRAVLLPDSLLSTVVLSEPVLSAAVLRTAAMLSNAIVLPAGESADRESIVCDQSSARHQSVQLGWKSVWSALENGSLAPRLETFLFPH